MRSYLQLLCVILFTLSSFTLTAQSIKTIKVISTEWCVDNLKITKFNNGDNIPLAKDTSDWTKAALEKKPLYGFIIKNGRQEYVYNFYVLIDDRGILPKGYAYPEDADFMQLENALKADASLVDRLNFYSTGVNSIDRYYKRFSYDRSCTAFWFKDNTWQDWVKDNMGTSYGLCEYPNCPSMFPKSCEGVFNRFETFYESGGSDAGNGMCIRLVKKNK
jgi:hypothetical protein